MDAENDAPIDAPDALVFPPHLDVRVLDGVGLVVGGEQGEQLFRGRAYELLGRAIDGRRDREGVLWVVHRDWRDRVEAAIVDLTQRALILESRTVAGSDAGWWASLGVSSVTATERFAAATVAVRRFGQVDVEPLERIMNEGGVQIVGGAANPTLHVVLVEDYLDEGLATFNEEALVSGQPWLVAQPMRTRTLIGPVFSPDAPGPCWECLAQRLRIGRGGAGPLGVRQSGSGPNGPYLPAPLATSAYGLIAGEVMRWIGEGRSGLDGCVLSIDMRSHASERHRVVWRPQCPACGGGGEPARAGIRPVVVSEAADTETTAELREADPSATIERFRHHVSPLTGAVPMLARRSRSELLHAYVSGGPLVTVHGDEPDSDRWSGNLSGGKGTSDLAACASALCEALERYSGGFAGDEPRRLARRSELGDAGFTPNELMHFSERQFDEREVLNAATGATHKSFVPERFDPDQALAYSPAWSLTHNTGRWLPTAFCFYGASVPGHPYCIAESNGNAAGNSLEEAILHGVLELIERDHVALWWYNRLRQPAIDLDTIAEPWLEAARAEFTKLDRDLWVLDLTADLGIPAAAAVSCNADGGDVGIGFGAHVDLGRAAVRAVTELVQLGLGAPSAGLGSRADQTRRAEAGSFLRPGPGMPLTRVGKPVLGSTRAMLAHVQAALERCGLELIVVDQTRPDIGLPVVKTVVPGLRHFWVRLGPGRLYDVPVKLGRQPASLSETELNPDPPGG